MKPANVLISETGQMKISDFGLARYFGTPEREMSGRVVTRYKRFHNLLFDLLHVCIIIIEVIDRLRFSMGASFMDLLWIYGRLGVYSWRCTLKDQFFMPRMMLGSYRKYLH